MAIFKTPILFIIFNRPDTTLRVFQEIRRVRPQQLFIAADGPRYPLKKEYALCQQIRAIAALVDWSCEVKTLFRDQNFGCGRGVSEAITWFFEHVEEGIILEDDCLPSTDFFIYCQRMLTLYKHDKNVNTICGSSLLGKNFTNVSGHYVGNSNGVWGWATWRRAWALYDYEIKRLYEPGVLTRMKKFFNNDIVFEHVVDTFKLFLNKKYDTWDIQWYFAGLSHNAWAVCPFQNMISNIGYDGAHDVGKTRLHDRERFPVDLSKIDERCIDTVVVRAAELEHFRFHGIYPRYLYLWKMQRRLLDLYVWVIIKIIGRRPVKFEGYVTAICWHLKLKYRKNINNLFLRNLL